MSSRSRRANKGLVGMLLRYPYEVRDTADHFYDIQDVKITKDMLDLAKHIVAQKSAHFEPAKFEDYYEAPLADLINKKRSGQAIKAPPRPRGDNVVDLMDALKSSISGEPSGASVAKPKKAKKANGHREMLLPISGSQTSRKRHAAPPPRPRATQLVRTQPPTRARNSL